VLACVLDECGFFRSDESANPDTEILTALRPSMAGVLGSVLLSISTPYSRRGELFKAYDRHFGQDESDVLVWQADTRAMNPCISERVVERAYEDDAIAAAAEYGASFRRDLEAFLTADAISGVTIPGRIELPYERDKRYSVFVDVSGGSQDSYTLGIAHRENGMAVLDVLRETQPPFSPEGVTADYAKLVKSYGCHSVLGDRYSGQWSVEQWQKYGVHYRHSSKSKSELYAELLPMVNSGKCELLDNRKLRAQLEGLERRVARSGKDSIDHAPGAHDDLCNVCAGALVNEAGKQHLTIGEFLI